MGQLKELYPEYNGGGDDFIDDFLDNALIVLDTNILLQVYRQSPMGREQLLGVLKRFDDRLWIPGHVAYEFSKNRAVVIDSRKSHGTAIREIIESSERLLLKALSDHFAGGQQGRDGIPDYASAVKDAFDHLRPFVKSQVDSISVTLNSDPILTELDELLDGKVGAEVSSEELAALQEKFFIRAAEEIPPGWKDKDKTENPAGDYIIWVQMMEKARESQRGILYVTLDVKDDQYLKLKSGKLSGPQPSLVREFQRETGQPYWQVRLSSLTHHVTRHFEVDATEIDTEDPLASQIASSVSEHGLEVGGGDRVELQNGVWRKVVGEADGRAGAAPWSLEAYKVLLERLTLEGSDEQLAAIRTAAGSGGRVTREQVYEVTERDATRTLTRFTMPARRVASELIEDGLLDAAAEPPLVAVYDGPGPAIGFDVPSEFIDFEL
ncbi:PIN-like domain-containing protein [Luteococcus sp. Sow4_B9]|uniref:PIN-like domain-containing protein n=1 Tax=Luteococcus sp. Sow4_B9 TaxID=3438792 RepID=UPI003F94F65C